MHKMLSSVSCCEGSWYAKRKFIQLNHESYICFFYFSHLNRFKEHLITFIESQFIYSVILIIFVLEYFQSIFLFMKMFLPWRMLNWSDIIVNEYIYVWFNSVVFRFFYYLQFTEQQLMALSLYHILVVTVAVSKNQRRITYSEYKQDEMWWTVIYERHYTDKFRQQSRSLPLVY